MDDFDWKAAIEACEAQGMSRREIAEHCGMSYSALCDVANGNSKSPRGMAAVKLFDIADPALKAAQAKQLKAADTPKPKKRRAA